MDQHAWPWLIYSELQFPLTLSLTLQNSSFYCKGFHRSSVYEGSHSINPLYFLIIKPTWHSFKPFHPATPRAPLLAVRARACDASLLFSATSRSALRHGAQIDDTDCLEISAPQQEFSYKQLSIHEPSMMHANEWIECESTLPSSVPTLKVCGGGVVVIG